MHILIEILQQYSELICAIVGALIAWGLTELSRHFANSYQKKQTLNSTLSLLLELYFQIKRIANAYNQSQDLVKWYENLLSQYNLSKEEKEAIGEIVREKIVPMISNLATDETLKLSKDYEIALEKLSCYYPVAAYRLRGRADIKHILIDLDDYLTKIEKQFPVEIGEYKEVITPLQTILQPTVINDNLSVLREEIVELSKSTSRKQRKEIMTTLNNIDVPEDSSKQYLDVLKEQVSTALEKAINNANND